MAENTSKKSQTSNRTEDPEEVAAREAGEQAPIAVEAGQDVVNSNVEAEKEASTDNDGNQVDPAVHSPRVVHARKR